MTSILIVCLFAYFQAIAFFAIIAVASAALLPSQSADGQAQTLRQDAAVNPESFQYVYQTSNGINAQEQGQLKQIGKEAGIATQGEYSYTAPDGQTIRVTYIADENGFQPTGSHLPQPIAPVAQPAPLAPRPVQPARFNQFQRRLG